MIDQLDAIDKKLLLFLNGIHSPFFDAPMWWISSTGLWVPFYVILLIFMLRHQSLGFKSQWLKNLVLIIGAVSLAILLADQISSGFFKPFFERLRPSRNPELVDQIHLLTKPNGKIYTGGKYGFVSSHAANSFAIAWLVSSILKHKFIWIGMFFWATLVSYSRIYLGVHYPGDIIGGALIGVFSGYMAYYLYNNLRSLWVR